MSDTVGNVVIGVTADIGPLIRETARAKAVMSGFQGAAQRMGAGLGHVGDVTGRLVVKLSIVTGVLAGVTAGALALTKNAAAMGDVIGDGAKAAGMGTTAFQEYRFAIKEAADMTDEEFSASMVKLNKTLGEAREGSKAAIKAFERIGVSQADIASGSVDTQAAMAAFVKKMEETTDPATAAAMATDLFGKSGASLGAALSGVPGQVGALVTRARELGVVMGPDAVKAAGEFDAKMNELNQRFEATKLQIANVLLPILNNHLLPFLTGPLLDGVQGVIAKIGSWITAFEGLDPALQAVIGAFGVAFAVRGPVLLAIDGVSTALSLIYSGPAAPLVLLVAAVTAGIAIWVTWGDDIKAAVNVVLGVIQSVIDLFNAGITKAKEFGTAIAGALSFGMDDRRDPANAGRVADDTGAGAFNTNQMGGTGGSNSSATGAAITDGIINGMSTRMTERLPEVAAIMQQVTDTANATFGVQSPSTVFAAMGQFIGQGLAEGIASTSGIVNSAISTMGAGAVQSNDAMVSGILGGLNTLFAGSQKAGAGLALVSTMVGAAKELQKGTFGFASAARVIAQGMAFVSAIKGAKNGGGSSRGRGVSVGGGGGGGSGPPVQRVMIDYKGPEAAMPSFEALVNLMNKAGKAGYVLNAQIVGAR